MKKTRTDQNGLVSIIVVTIIISVTALIALGFASIVRREQRQSLDLQLSSQAKLAAESAINDKIAEYREDPTSLTNSEECRDSPTFGTSASEIVTTCVQVITAPSVLEIAELSTHDSRVFWLDPGSTPIDRLVISWQNPASADGHSCLTTTYDNLPQNVTGTDLGMIRYDLSHVGPGGGTFTFDSLMAGTMGGVLYPKSGSGTVSTVGFTTNPTQQPRVFGRCAGTPPANVPDPLLAYAVINIPTGLNSDRFVLRLRSLYRNSNVKIVGIDTSDQVVYFKDSQVVIEATARTNDVVQRIQIRLPAGSPPQDFLPDSALHVTNAGICKLLRTEPASTNDICPDASAQGGSTTTIPPPEPAPEPDPTPVLPPGFCISDC